MVDMGVIYHANRHHLRIVNPPQATAPSSPPAPKRQKPPRSRRPSMARWGRLDGIGLFACSNCENFERPTPARPQGCAGQGISATARPCALDRNGFGFFRPEKSSEAAESVDFSACTEPDELLLLLYRVRRRLVDMLNGARGRLRIGEEAIDAEGRRGVIVRINSRSVYLADDGGEWRVPVGSAGVLREAP
jgi:hypothetical protein